MGLLTFPRRTIQRPLQLDYVLTTYFDIGLDKYCFRLTFIGEEAVPHLRTFSSFDVSCFLFPESALNQALNAWVYAICAYREGRLLRVIQPADRCYFARSPYDPG